MVVSLFSRKDRSGARKGTRDDPRSAARNPREPAARSARRESALRTEQAIDRIESEMVDSLPIAGPGALAPSHSAARARGGADAQAAEATRAASTFAMNPLAEAIVIDVQASDLPAILEEAAVLYANGQGQSSARILHRCLEDGGLGAHQSLAWLMLLDLRQCTGDRAGFDALAARYAECHGAAAPIWNPALSPTADADAAARPVVPESAQSPESAPPAGDSAEPDGWMICGVLDEAAGRSLHGWIDSPEQHPELDALAVTAIDPAGAQAMLGLLKHFEGDSRALVLRGARRLYGLVRASIEPGRRDSSDACWMLALYLLRVLDRQAEFDDLAIEYCITHEVSPPSWEPLPGSIRVSDEEGVPAHMNGSGAHEASRSPASEAPPPASRPDGSNAAGFDDPAFALLSPAGGRAFALQGELAGHVQDEFEALRGYAAERSDVVIDCRGLRRIEFVAAGDLLNEVATMRSAGRQVLFIEPNYLVYALMLVMGIHDLAEIRRRRI